VDEAGRPTEPPGTADESDGSSPGSTSGVPPLPADEIGRAKPGSPYALGYRSGLAASSAPSASPGEDGRDPAKGGGPVTSNSTDSDSVNGDISAVGDSSSDGETDIAGVGAALGGKLEGGRQAMRQAAAATTSWFASRAGTQTATRPPAEPAVPSEAGFRPEATAEPETRPQSLPPVSPPPSSSSPSSSPWSSSAAAAQAGGAAAAGGGPVGGQSAARAAGYANAAATPGWQTRATGPGRGPGAARRSQRQAHLTLARVEPWSVMKFSFVASVVAFIILFVAVTVLYMALSALGVFTSLQHTVSTITSSQGTTGTNISGWFSASRILGYTGMLGALNIVLITALSTIGAVVYNLIAHVFGGVEVTLRETD
jgi:transmembrane protein DUF3566